MYSRHKYSYKLQNSFEKINIEMLNLAKELVSNAKELGSNNYLNKNKQLVHYYGFYNEQTNIIEGYLVVHQETKCIFIIFNKKKLWEELSDKFNCKQVKIYNNKVKVHWKYYKDYTESKLTINTLYNKFTNKYPNYSTVIIGSNSGAAKAVFFTLDLIKNNTVTNLILFKPPKMGNKFFYHEYFQIIKKNNLPIYWKK